MPWYNFISIGSGNGSVPDGIKTLPEPMLTYYHSFYGIHLSIIAFAKNTQDMKHLDVLQNYTSVITTTSRVWGSVYTFKKINGFQWYYQRHFLGQKLLLFD